MAALLSILIFTLSDRCLGDLSDCGANQWTEVPKSQGDADYCAGDFYGDIPGCKGPAVIYMGYTTAGFVSKFTYVYLSDGETIDCTVEAAGCDSFPGYPMNCYS